VSRRKIEWLPESSLLEVQIYLIRKINAITAEILGIICSRINVLKLIYTDNESKSKVDINNNHKCRIN